MPRAKRTAATPIWGHNGKPPTARERTYDEFTALRQATKLRTLHDMTEREIRALERYYGCPVIRPEGRRARRVSQGAATV